MINSFLRLEGADLGCDPTGLVTFTYILSGNDYVKPIGSYHNYPLVDVSPVPALTFDRLYERILAVPGVQSAAGSVYLPLTGGENMSFNLEGRPKPVNDVEKNALSAMFFPVTAKLFSTLRAPLLRGRDFTARDTASAPWVTIIDQTMARPERTGQTEIRRRSKPVITWTVSLGNCERCGPTDSWPSC